jgi:DnaJ-class molecular chaperone
MSAEEERNCLKCKGASWLESRRIGGMVVCSRCHGSGVEPRNASCPSCANDCHVWVVSGTACGREPW